MPLYDYACAKHGAFRDWRPMSECDQPVACPECGAASARLVAMPFLPRVSRNVRIAHELNEKSADEPKVMRREEMNAASGRLGKPGRRVHQHAAGRNMYRPTMLGHAH